jgi:hypothetical protein
MNDPIIDLLALFLKRLVLFLILTALIGLALWLWILMAEFDVAFHDLGVWWHEGWTPVSHKLPVVMLRGALTIGFLTTGVVYLLIGKWWKKRGDVYHRGAKLEQGSL